MRIIFCMLYPLVSLDYAFCMLQEDSVKTKFGLHSGIQLSSTKWNVPLIAEVFNGHNFYYLGMKIPVSTNNLYGYFPVGAIGGYGYRLIQNEKWHASVLLDLQWLGSKTKNQIKPSHYVDVTFNYQLTYKMRKNIYLISSFGYGAFTKYFYMDATNEWEKTAGVSGLIRLGVKYNL